MTEKQYTIEEINKKTNEIYLSYFEHYKADKMSFAEITLIENVIVRIQTSIGNDGDTDD